AGAVTPPLAANGAGGPSDTAGDASQLSSPPGERAPPAPSPVRSGKDWRFDMRQDGHTMTADEFDAWMRARRASVATGKPQAAPASTASRDASVATTPASPAAAMPAPVPPAVPADAGAITLQVASFAARANAERALAMLSGAGIGNARLLDADANGRKVWRLRVGPVDPSAAAELGKRLQGLGFGQPQRVRE
ncbi:MAG: SPOR domain-containing protein, partial [Lysobacteraceae bacterium]